MHCRNCGSGKNRVASTIRRNAQGIFRTRQCVHCENTWSTFEGLQACSCGSYQFDVYRVEHHGADAKLRERICRKCGAKVYTFEKKTSDQIERRTA